MDDGGYNRLTSEDRQLLGLRESLEAIAFWAAIVLPLAYVPLLTGGLATPRRGAMFATLAVLHLVVLTIGHAHGR